MLQDVHSHTPVHIAQLYSYTVCIFFLLQFHIYIFCFCIFWILCTSIPSQIPWKCENYLSIKSYSYSVQWSDELHCLLCRSGFLAAEEKHFQYNGGKTPFITGIFITRGGRGILNIRLTGQRDQGRGRKEEKLSVLRLRTNCSNHLYILSGGT